MTKRNAWSAIALAVAASAGTAWTGESANAVEVRHDESTLCLTYRARLEGALLVIEAAIEPGWHTFAMDNQKRAEEKLAGRKALSVDQPTEISVGGGLAVAGHWRQSAPKDFSKPELRWFSWGFEKKAVFATEVRRVGSGAARIGIRGQACTESICKNIDVALTLVPPRNAAKAAETGVAQAGPKDLILVRR